MSTIVYLLNGIDGNSLTQGVFSNNKMLKFGIGGKYLGEFSLSYSYSRLREIDFVSIINVKNQMEVAYVIDKEFKKYPIYTDVYEIINWLNKQPSLVFVGKRNEVYSDKIGDVEYSQYFFGFTKGKLDENQLQEVMRVNG